MGYFLLRPAQAQLAVAEGALYAPTVKMNYIVKKTIGIQVSGEWKDNDPTDCKIPDFNWDSGYKRIDLFYPLISIDDMFENEKTIELKQFGIPQNAISLKVALFSPKIARDIPKSVYDCDLISEWIVQLSKPSPRYTRVYLSATFYPSLLEMKVQDPFQGTKWEKEIEIECFQVKK